MGAPGTGPFYMTLHPPRALSIPLYLAFREGAKLSYFYTQMDIEYAYIHTRNGKVIGLQPATQEGWATVLDIADYDVVLNQLVEARWELVNPGSRPSVAGDSFIRLRKEVDSQTKTPDNLRVQQFEINANADNLDAMIEQTRQDREVVGWNLLLIVNKGGQSKLLTMVFGKPSKMSRS